MPRFSIPILLAVGATAAAAGCALASDRLGWPFDLAVHFWPHIAIAAALLLAVAAWRMVAAARVVALLGCGGAIAAAAASTHAALPSPSAVPPPGPSQRIVVAAANIWGGNSEYARIVDWVRRERPDVLILSEIGDASAIALAGLRDVLPHIDLDSLGDLGIASRWPWIEVDRDLRALGQAATIRIATPSGPLRLIAAHALVPASPPFAQRRDRLIRRIAEIARDSSDPVIVAGDFNATPWSAPMRDLVTTAGLAYGPGAWDSTWPVVLPRPFGVAIDHVLAGKGCRVLERHHGERIGSDHWPIVATVGCGAAPAPVR